MYLLACAFSSRLDSIYTYLTLVQHIELPLSQRHCVPFPRVVTSWGYQFPLSPLPFPACSRTPRLVSLSCCRSPHPSVLSYPLRYYGWRESEEVALVIPSPFFLPSSFSMYTIPLYPRIYISCSSPYCSSLDSPPPCLWPLNHVLSRNSGRPSLPILFYVFPFEASSALSLFNPLSFYCVASLFLSTCYFFSL